MSRQIITTTPLNSGNGDTLPVAFGKVNSMTEEIYTSLSGLSATVITNTSQLTNDGADGTHPFITIEDVPTTIEMSQVTGEEGTLNTVLEGMQLQLDDFDARVYISEQDIADLQTGLSDANTAIQAMNTIITNQNTLITAMQAQIADLYNIVNNL